MPASEPELVFRCSFCGIDQETATHLIAGPGVYVCGSCIRSLAEILDEIESDEAEGGAGQRK